MNINDQQAATCHAYGVDLFPSPAGLKVGVALNVKSGIQPINGLRHRPEGDTTGWYIWAGEELSSAADFFKPLHVEHLAEWCPQVRKFLGLPPGWRFLLADEHEDAWFDASLLHL